MSDVLAGLLNQLDVAPISVQDEVDDVVNHFLQSQGYDSVEILGVRDGTLSLRADAFTAALLKVDTYQLLARLQDMSAAVTAIQVVCTS